MTEQIVALGQLAAQLGATKGLNEVVETALQALDGGFGYRYSLMLLHDDAAGRLFTIGSHGYETQGIGSEVGVGEGVIGMAAERRAPMRLGTLQRMLAYARTVRRSAEAQSSAVPGAEISLPGLQDAQSQLAVPMMSRGALVGVMAVESRTTLAFDEHDERLLTVIAQLTGEAIELERTLAGDAAVSDDAVVAPDLRERASGIEASERPVGIRHFAVDGSTFIGDEYIIKGVAGRLLWKLACEHEATGRVLFSNREVRLDPALDLPAYRDNFESRLILLKRRLDERQAPLRIESTGRGRFRLLVSATLSLEAKD
ncbi:MAG: putative phosphoenolpyruvate-protein phosphotransferase [Acidimicrobiia bacterium]|nr:putative phosphoenolpyruvate-protein phosphotransferase [Acidimicrobiia bacterium]